MNIRPLLIVAPIIPLALMGNNIQVSNVTLTGQNTASDTYQVQFDISWENSWRTSTAEANYDAAWIFLKFRANNGPWQHGYLNSTGHVAAGGATLSQTADNMGAFIFRSSNGTGNVNFTGSQLSWNYGASSMTDNAIVEIRVLAVEMVFIPQGPFSIGDGTSTGVAGQFELGQTGAPYQVTSEAAITMGGAGASSLNARNNTGVASAADFTYTTTQTLPAAYPKGFNAFYVMKYELTEGQWVDFLNMLTATQVNVSFPNQTGVSGHTIDDTGPAPDVYVTTAAERPCGFISGIRLNAYADWAGMRPMSELEFEKIARGPLAAVANEFAWGTTVISSVNVAMNAAGTSSETITVIPAGGGGTNWDLTNGSFNRPWRAGIVPASSVAPTRVLASSGYYGVMDLSGDLTEPCSTVGNTGGRTLPATTHGDGVLDASGFSNVAGWSGSMIARGGGFSVTSTDASILRISDRSQFVLSSNQSQGHSGLRLCRMP